MRIFTGLLGCLIAVNSAPAFADNTAKYAQCAADLCGPSSSYARILARGNFGIASQESKAFIKNNLEQDLELALDRAFQTQSQIHRLTDAYVKKSDLNLSDKQRAILSVSAYGALVGEKPEVIVSTDGHTFQVDAAKIKKAYPKLSDEKVATITSVVNAYLANEDTQNGMRYEQIQYDQLIEYWGIANAPSYTLYAMSLIPNIEAVFGASLNNRIHADILAKASKNPKSLSDAEKKLFTSTLGNIFRTSAMISTSVVEAARPGKLSMLEAATLLEWPEKSAKIAAALSSTSEIEKNRQEARKVCREAWTQSLASAPSELRQRTRDTLLNRVKESSKRVTPRYFTGNALVRANKAIDTLTYTKPLNEKQIKASLIEGFATFGQKNQKLANVVANNNRSEADSIAFVIMTLMGPKADKLNIFEEVKAQCEGMAPRHFNDAAYQPLNTIITSWQSTMFPEIGAGVIAHEMGHIISYATQLAPTERQNYENARQCSISKHATLAKDSDVKKYAQYAEEDWADVFAADVLLDLEKTWPHKANFSCALLRAEDDFSKYKDLEIFDESGIDTHSPSFLRALQTQSALKLPIPASCQQALEEHEKSVVGKSCSY